MLPPEMVAEARAAHFWFERIMAGNESVSRNSMGILTYLQKLHCARWSRSRVKKKQMLRVQPFDDDLDVSRRGSVEVPDGAAANDPHGCAGDGSLESGG